MTIHHADDWLTIHGGDCREVLRTLPDESVQCVVTSPPYFGLRDYGTASWDGGDPECDHAKQRSTGASTLGQAKGQASESAARREAAVPVPYRDRCGKCGAIRQDRQLGLEQTPEEYVAALVDVFREVRRVLRRDGTLWLNLGDSHNSPGANNNGRNSTGLNSNPAADVEMKDIRTRRIGTLKPKDLVGIPWRVAFALQADGWYLRSDIIWSKPNPMPESVTDRPTKAHEYLFLLSKSERYHYDHEAIREPVSPYNEGIVSVAPHGAHVMDSGHRQQETRRYDVIKGANKRSVWTIATKPYPGAHFATFPEALVEPCILAGTSQAGACATCGAPWRRVVERTKYVPPVVEAGQRHVDDSRGDKVRKLSGPEYNKQVTSTTTGWQPTCDHGGDPVPCVVLDIFAGTGTVGVVAQRLSRRAVLIDLNPDYLRQCLERNQQSPLGLTA